MANREAMKAVDLAASEPGWATLDERVEERRGGYRVDVVRDALPDELLDGYLAMLGQLMSQVPQGDLHLETLLECHRTL